MEFKFQECALQQLRILAEHHRHSILIDGPTSCGKSYLVTQFAKMLGIEDVIFVKPSVDNVRSVIAEAYSQSTEAVICIENLDTGVLAASYALLKFLEEPPSYIYIVVTCRNRKYVPDTIISRSSIISITPPTDADVRAYAKSNLDYAKFDKLSKLDIWQAVKSFSDVDYVADLTASQIEYYQNAINLISSKKSVSDIVWALGHFEENTTTNLTFMLQYIMVKWYNYGSIREACIDCLKQLNQNRLASHAILAKFVLECKYSK